MQSSPYQPITSQQIQQMLQASQQFGTFGQNTPQQQQGAQQQLGQMVKSTPTVNGRPNWLQDSQEAQLQSSVAQNKMDGGFAHTAAPLIAATIISAATGDALGGGTLGQIGGKVASMGLGQVEPSAMSAGGMPSVGGGSQSSIQGGAKGTEDNFSLDALFKFLESFEK